MNVVAYSQQVQAIANALWALERAHGTDQYTAALHSALGTGLSMLQADNPGIVTPTGGSNKPPQIAGS